MADDKTPEQLADAREHTVQMYSYRDAYDGTVYAVGPNGKLTKNVAADVKPLSEKYQKIAEQTAALMVMVSKTQALNPDDPSIADGVMGARDKAAAALDGVVKDVFGKGQEALGVKLKNPMEGVTDTVGTIGDGLSLLPTGVRETGKMLSDVAKQFGGGVMSKENALAIGVAYASARQAEEDARAKQLAADGYWGGIKKHPLAFAMGGLGYLLDQLMGFLEQMPIIGDFIKEQKWHKGMSLAHHLDEAMMQNDNKEVGQEMAELKHIGGRSSVNVANALTTSNTARDVAGNDAQIKPAEHSNEAPTIDRKATPGAVEVPATLDEAVAVAQANKKVLPARVVDTLNNSFQETKEKGHNLGFWGTTGSMVAGGATAVGAGRGIVEGFQRGPVKKLDEKATALEVKEKALEAKEEALKAKLAKNPDNLRLAGRLKTVENSLSEISDEAARAREAATEAKATLKGRTAMELGINGKRSALWHSWSNGGRVIGEAGRGAWDGAAKTVDNIVTGTVERVQQVATVFDKPAAQFAAGQATAHAEIAEKDAKKLGDVVKKAAAKAEGKGFSGALTGAGGRAAAARKVKALTPDLNAAIMEDAARAGEKILATNALDGAKPNLVHGAGGLWARVTKPFENIFGNSTAKAVASVTDDAKLATSVAAAADTAADAAKVARTTSEVASKASWFAPLLRGASKLPVVGKYFLGAAVVTGATVTAASAHEALANPAAGKAADATANGLDLVSLPFLFLGSAPRYAAEGFREQAKAERASQVSDADANTLIAMIHRVEKMDPQLEKLVVLKEAITNRRAQGLPMEVSITIARPSLINKFPKIRSIDEALSPSELGVVNAFENAPQVYNANLETKLMEEAKIYLGNQTTLTQVAAHMGVKPAQEEKVTLVETTTNMALSAAAVEATEKARLAQAQAQGKGVINFSLSGARFASVDKTTVGAFVSGLPTEGGAIKPPARAAQAPATAGAMA